MKSSLEALVTEMVDKGILFQDAVAEFEKHFILSVLRKTRGNLSKAADELRIHRNTLSRRVEKYYQNGHMAGARHRRPRTQTVRPSELKAKAGR
ncbi:MAG TPA: helix-turn-helix domain-containing protein [Blastocatellia bacterium]|nr:helix-turn-helix domain-containing protein [Blastocatellia bacterium]